jgi:hypothetical protein
MPKRVDALIVTASGSFALLLGLLKLMVARRHRKKVAGGSDVGHSSVPPFDAGRLSKVHPAFVAGDGELARWRGESA